MATDSLNPRPEQPGVNVTPNSVAPGSEEIVPDSPLLTAEMISSVAFQNQVDVALQRRTITRHLGWSLVELGLSSPDDELADRSFVQAAQVFEYTSGIHDHTDLRSSLDHRFLPAFRQRRFWDSVAPDQEPTYRAISESLRHILPSAIALASGETEGGDNNALGLLAEMSTMGLLARKGYQVYITSLREGGSSQVLLNHDMYILEAGEKDPPIEAKYNDNSKRHPYDTTQIFLTTYAHISRFLMRTVYEWQSMKPNVSETGALLGTAVFKELEGQSLADSEVDMLNIASSYLIKQIDLWRKRKQRFEASAT